MIAKIFKSTFLVGTCFIMSSCLFTGCEKAGAGEPGEPDDPKDPQEEVEEPVAPPDPEDHADLRNYTLLWSDEFDGGELNTQDWSIEVNGDGGGNNELQYYRKENISLGEEPDSGENCLIITARKETHLGKRATSGRLTSAGKAEFQYGRVDGRIKLPKTANGLWPAFWMMGNYKEVGWPACGEIDIMEIGSSGGISRRQQDRYFNGACHWGPRWSPTYPNYAKSSTADYGLQDDFHLWTLIWSETSLDMYLDLDEYPDTDPYFSMGITDMSGENATGLYFHKPFHILLNMAVGGNFTGILDIDKVTALDGGDAYMYVDYVRVYKRNPASQTD